MPYLLDHLLAELLGIWAAELLGLLDLAAPFGVAGLLSLDVQNNLLLVVRSPFGVDLGDELLLLLALFLLVGADGGVGLGKHDLGLSLHGPLALFAEEWRALDLELSLDVAVERVALGFELDLSGLVLAAALGLELELDVVLVGLAGVEVIELTVKVGAVFGFVVLVHFVVEIGFGAEALELAVGGLFSLLEEFAGELELDLARGLFGRLEFDLDVVLGGQQGLDDLFIVHLVWHMNFSLNLKFSIF